MRVIVHQLEGTSTLRALPLAAGLLASSLKADPALSGVEVSIDVTRRDPDEVVDRVVREAAVCDDLVLAFSLYAWNARYSLEVVRRLRSRWASLPPALPTPWVVVGGPSVPRRPEAVTRFLAEHPVDVLVHGEGELTFRELVGSRLSGADAGTVSGAVVRCSRSSSGYRAGPRRGRLRGGDAFEGLGSPFLDGTFDRLLAEQPGHFTAAVLETNRGCPFSCTFCDWGQATQSRVNELPEERVLAELDWVGGSGLGYLYIVDANFGIRPRDVDLVRHLAAVYERHGGPGFCYFHLTKNARERNLRTVETLLEAGIACQVALSMQDFDERVLEAVRRRNIRVEEALELRRICNDRGIPTFNELLLGLPEQTYDSFRRSLVEAVTPYPTDSFFLYLARLLENAEMASATDRERFGLRTRECPIGDASRRDEPTWVDELEEVVVATRAMPMADWRRAYRFGNLLGALYNLRLAWVGIQVLRYELGLDLADWLEAVLDAMAMAPEGAALAELGDRLESYERTVLRGGPLVLPDRPGDEQAWSPVDAVALLALRRREAFYQELADVTRRFVLERRDELGGRCELGELGDAERMDELFRFEAFCLPGLDRREPEVQTFTCDWLGVDRDGAGGARLQVRPVRLRYVPPPTALAATSWAQFSMIHTAAMRAKGAARPVVEVDSAAERGEPLPQRALAG